MSNDVSRMSPRTLKRLLLLSLMFAIASCTRDNGLLAYRSAPTPQFDVGDFFSGRTVGNGVLKIVFRRAEPTMVQGYGQLLGDRTIILDQSVRRGHRHPSKREWRLKPDGHGGYVGTLTDAVGPVVGSVTGNCFHLEFKMKGGMNVEQWLSLAPDGMTAHNIMIVKKLGLQVARLTEEIRKTPG